MDLDKLAAERSLAFHRVVATRLLDDSTILDFARQRVKSWMAESPHRPYIKEWAKILGGSTQSVVDFLVDGSERAVELRQSSPFAGVLSARERWRIWAETRQSLERKA
jgi:hypothetical protein